MAGTGSATIANRDAGPSIRDRIERILHVEPNAKPEIELHSRITCLRWDRNTGPLLNSPAVVIGAMLISPLMGSIVAAGLAVAAGDVYLGFKSLLSIVLSIVLAVLFSAALVWILPFHYPTA